MGAKHRLAARMQNEASGKASTKRGSAFGSFALLKSRAFVTSVIVVGCLVLSFSFLYPSAQQYYHALRDRDRLAAEYAALADRNESLEGNVEALQTDSGIEAYAHEQFGWVKEGEETANVRGLDLPEEGSTFQANIVSDSIEAPETWYSVLLDPLFGVE
ncbi:FtsB family cell division protein [Gordonibacter sp. An230]|uniref:FtsB family cell division protein n=1 Tax=Gordonibacter sp. An230 TaxID=1965592 RepID=UPI001EF50380|nr:septum formation initiator family protein [Gordonibacter sp. An230]